MNYLDTNKHYWDARVEDHSKSDFYAMDKFMAGATSLNPIELGHLPDDLSGKRILHLQCHFGQDSLSLARMGAEVTGVDLSSEAIFKAQEVAEELNLNAKFVNCDVYSAVEHVSGQFDYVFTSYGTIGWLPDLDKWAEIISHFLAPGGQFLIVDFHPAVWMFDDDFTHIKYSYFNRQTINETTEGTYTDKGKDLKEAYTAWNHDLGEMFTALLKQGLTVKSFSEYDTSPYPCFNKVVQVENGFQIDGMEGKLPMVYALQCEKPL
ncbi:MAG: class I SAM-dependent methyltransferase [Flavobacteriales bacterium]